jgi:hypothetical protein
MNLGMMGVKGKAMNKANLSQPAFTRNYHFKATGIGFNSASPVSTVRSHVENSDHWCLSHYNKRR